jgi:hypothetical protein
MDATPTTPTIYILKAGGWVFNAGEAKADRYANVPVEPSKQASENPPSHTGASTNYTFSTYSHAFHTLAMYLWEESASCS